MFEYYVKKVTKVVDGDTIDVDIDLGFDISFASRVRLAGIDTPESRTTDKIEKTVDGQKFLRAIETTAKIKRSKVSKPQRYASTIITMDYGVDNIGSCLLYLLDYKESYLIKDVVSILGIEEGLISNPKDKKEDFEEDSGKKITRIRLTRIIEDNGLEMDLSKKVEEVWLSREAKVEEPRKRKF
jgi:hypothetical protein